MSVQVEGLEIEVKSKADETKNSIKGLKDALKELKSVVTSSNKALGNFTKKLEGMGGVPKQVETIKKMSQAYTHLKTTANKAGNALKKVNTENPNRANMQEAVKTSQAKSGNQLSKEIGELKVDDQLYEQELKNQAASLRAKAITLMGNDDIKGLKTVLSQYKAVENEIDRINKKSKSFSKVIDSISHSAKNLLPAVRKLIGHIARTAMYRAIRTVLSQTVNLLKEGVSNAYQFSKAMGGELANKVDTVNSKYLQLKNQLGAVAGEILLMVFPSLVGFMNKAIDFANKITQIMAILNGKTTYKKANYIETAWKDATASAKAYKSQVLGIDELNILSDDSGSGGTSSDASYADMYTYENVNGAYKKTAEEIAEIFDKIKTNVVLIGAGILAWRASSGLLGVLEKIGKLSMKQSIGLNLAIIGGTIEFIGAYNMGKYGADFKNVIATALGAGALIGGGALAFGTTAMGAAMSLLVTIPLAIIIGSVAFKMGQNAKIVSEWEKTTLGQTHLRISNDFEQLRADNVELKAKITSITGSISAETSANLTTARKLIEDIFTIDAKDNKTAQEIEELKIKVESLNSLGLDGIQLEFDEVTGKVSQTKKEVLDTIEALTKQYKMQAMSEGLVEAYKAEQEALINLQQAKQEFAQYEDLYNYYKNIQDSWSNAYQELTDFINNQGGYSEVFTRTGQYIGKNTEEYQKLKDAVEEAGKKADESLPMWEKVKAEYENQKTALGELQESYDLARQKVFNLETELTNYVNGSQAVIDANARIAESYRNLADARRDAATTTAPNLQSTTSSVQQRIQYKANGGIVEKYASGGVPTHGQLFIANEGNSPEMIGSWGTQTAVANTDQIVNGIQAGVSSAVNAVLAPYLSQIANNTKETANKKLSVNIGDREIAKANARGSKMLGRTIIATS